MRVRFLFEEMGDEVRNEPVREVSFHSFDCDVKDGFGSLSRQSLEVRIPGHHKGRSNSSVHELHECTLRGSQNYRNPFQNQLGFFLSVEVGQAGSVREILGLAFIVCKHLGRLHVVWCMFKIEWSLIDLLHGMDDNQSNKSNSSVKDYASAGSCKSFSSKFKETITSSEGEMPSLHGAPIPKYGLTVYEAGNSSSHIWNRVLGGDIHLFLDPLNVIN
ncbi:hypothetical protein VNO77_41593 [Canavalia gladiata]|uniref:Uncharacterized protein n=1 Tax=Canavalia gladiata TaxID=3824 RepID=A0AAN9JZK0_CANGL